MDTFYFYQGKKRQIDDDYIYRCQIDLDDTMIPLNVLHHKNDVYDFVHKIQTRFTLTPEEMKRSES
jgi:hypothetical protein